MNYRVIWKMRPWALLNQWWTQSANPSEIADARRQIEQALGDDPHRNGTPLSEGLWKYDCYPLRVCFTIDSPRARVVISDVLKLSRP